MRNTTVIMDLKWCFLKTFVILALYACPIYGQVKHGEKKDVTPSDYALWSDLQLTGISDGSSWTSYMVNYASGTDTLYVQSTSKNTKYTFPAGKRSSFINEDWFVYINKSKVLNLVVLSSGKSTHIENVFDYQISHNKQFLIIVKKEKKSLYSVIFLNVKTSEHKTIENVHHYRFSPYCSQICYSTELNGITYLKTLSFENTLRTTAALEFKDVSISGITWQRNAKSVAFILEDSDFESKPDTEIRRLGFYDFTKRKLYILDTEVTKDFPSNYRIANEHSSGISISEDGLRIILEAELVTKNNEDKASEVEVWHGDDKRIFTNRKLTGDVSEWPKPIVWYPVEDRAFHFMPDEAYVLLSSDHKIALSSRMDVCPLEFRFLEKRDFYLTDLMSGKKELILPCHSGEVPYSYISPKNNYIVYFKDSHWYSYDVMQKKHLNLTASVNSDFYNVESTHAGDKTPNPFMGWSKEGTSIFITDQYDIWEFASDGSKNSRITDGRENGIIYRMATVERNKLDVNFQSVDFPVELDMDKGILLKGTNKLGDMEGYFLAMRNGVEKLLYTAARLAFFQKANQSNSFVYTQSQYDSPPQLKFQKHSNAKPKMLFQSNPHHSDFKWGKNEYISYTNKEGVEHKGILYYPSGYKKDLKYPMVVEIYEHKSYLKNHFIRPTFENSNGMNVTNYVTQGYFVLLPDITYTLGSPGVSALDCVNSAVVEALKLKAIDSKRIGLIGHSFGGYETSYIVSRSSLFAAAVAGAPQTNLISTYLTAGKGYQRPEFWRFEHFSNRMGKSLFEDMENYIYNSPIFHASNITTPLLIWTGDKDGIVAPEQSMELYLALRRLKKKVSMLRYPDEHHNLFAPRKQIDLSQKVMDWFNYYLKNEPEKNWMQTEM